MRDSICRLFIGQSMDMTTIWCIQKLNIKTSPNNSIFNGIKTLTEIFKNTRKHLGIWQNAHSHKLAEKYKTKTWQDRISSQSGCYQKTEDECWRGREERENSFTRMVGTWVATIMGNGIEMSQKLKTKSNMTQQFHYWAHRWNHSIRDAYWSMFNNYS